jgi:hypothetical protein
MTAQSGLGFSGIVAIQIPDDGAAGTVLTKLTPDNYDYDWLPGGGGGGGQVNTVVGGVNITVNAGDPINPIVNLDAAITGVSVNGVTLNAVGVATNFLNETGAYSVPPVDTVTADAIYLRLDTTNNPLTGNLDFNTGGDAVIYNRFLDGDIHFDVNNTGVGPNKRAMTIIAEDPVQGSSSVDLRPSDTCYLSNFVFLQNNIELVNTESGIATQVLWRLDNAVPATGIRTWGVGTTDPGFGSFSIGLGTGAGDTSFNFVGAFDVAFTLSSGQVFDFNAPITMTNALSPIAFNIAAADTFTTGGGFNGGVLDSTGTITYDNGFFIWGLMVERKTYIGTAAPTFAAFTLFNALPVIQNGANVDLVAALTLNVGITHARTTAGTSSTVGTTGLSFSAQSRATVNGAVLTKSTGDVAVRVSPTFSTVAGSTVNMGTIRGMQCFEPVPALFQPSAGTENMTAYYGVDFPNMTFGGANRIINVVRSSLNAATNVRFLNNLGTAVSDFGNGLIHLNDNVSLALGNTVAAPDAAIQWIPGFNALDLSGGRVRVQGAMEYPPINPAALAAGNNNDWTGLLTNAVSANMRHWARISGNVVTSVLTGIVTTVIQDGDSFELTNVSANAINITHQDIASAAANRIISPTGATYILGVDETVLIRYDATTARWRLLSGTGA